MGRLYLSPKEIVSRLPVPTGPPIRSRTCRRGHLVVEGTDSAYVAATGFLVCAECRRRWSRNAKARVRAGHIPTGASWNPWAGQLGCPTCRSSRFTLPYHPGDPRWRCVACHIWIVA